MSEQNLTSGGECPIVAPCPVDAVTLTPLNDDPSAPCLVPHNVNPVLKVPVVLAERTIQIVVESNIPLNPPASEIKRVFKDVFITQCKLVPVRFGSEVCNGQVRTVTRAKLFVEGFIRKDIEYATTNCNGFIRDRIATIPFSGFAEIGEGDFLVFPTIGESFENRSRFIDPRNSDIPRLDKYFFENNVYYNEQPYCELISADFFELDFSPCPTEVGASFSTLREKIVVDLTLKVLQVRQVRVNALP
ncbi:CsxC family protein [Bacillus sp. FJAT-22090]|uniref:CsxC family protein n=1 Tax=Bacillus sp. FJAT-22090 TaxID=1581038 RepID=UPI0011A2F1E8|nr:Uracil permease [Bacillus sp. FJAT-22090]